jgi:hypothetical protein
MSERNAFILFFIGVFVMGIAWPLGLRFLGAGEESMALGTILLLPVVGLGGGWLFMRYH